MHHANPKLGPVFSSKVDISDGFCQIWLRAANVPKLEITFPSQEGEEPPVALPLTLPVGWRESPPWFCAATETVADLANETMRLGTEMPAHRLDAVSETPPPSLPAAAADGHPDRQPRPTMPTLRSFPRPRCHCPLNCWDVCVDDFIGLAQGNR